MVDRFTGIKSPPRPSRGVDLAKMGKFLRRTGFVVVALMAPVFFAGSFALPAETGVDQG
jgi:hypothetical protein